VADGGFYDNYGAATVLDAYNEVKRLTLALPKQRQPQIIVIQITSDPECEAQRFLGAQSFEAECRTLLAQLRKQEEPYSIGLTHYRQSDMNHNSLYLPWLRLVRPTPKWEESPGPLGVLMRARAINGAAAAEELRRRTLANGDCYHLFSMAGAFDAPLGWELSEAAKDQLDRRLNAPANATQMKALISELSLAQTASPTRQTELRAGSFCSLIPDPPGRSH
jgi:hypothetical protein